MFISVMIALMLQKVKNKLDLFWFMYYYADIG